MENSTKDTEVSAPGQGSKRLSLKRNVACFSAVIAVYCLIGSAIAPYCAYGYIWRLSVSENPCWLGLSVFTERPYLSFAVLLVLVYFEKIEKIASPALLSVRNQVMPWVDQYWKAITSASVLLLIATAGGVYLYANEGYDFWVASQSAEIRIDDGSFLKEEPKIDAPIDFLFIDRNSVDALYNQIEPDLIEKRRTVSNSGKLSGKAGIEAGGVTAALDSEKGKDSIGSYERIEFAPARRCLTVMQFVADSRRAAYYTTFNDWRLVREAQEKLAEDFHAAEKGADRSRIARQDKGPALKTVFLKELQEAEGLVFVRGQFSQSPGQQPGTLVMTSEFPGAPKRVFFKVLVPRQAPNGSDDLRIAGGANLVVFGRITKPLTENGTVEIRPFAIF